MLCQKEARFQVIIHICQPIDNKVVLSKDQVVECAILLADLTVNREVDMRECSREKFNTIHLMINYWKGSVRDALRKDIRLNGGFKYVAPESRTRMLQAYPAPDYKGLKLV